MQVLLERSGQSITLNSQTDMNAAGGAGMLHRHPNNPTLCIKLYKEAKHAAEHEAKVRVMVANPPAGASFDVPGAGKTWAVAWPQDVAAENGRFVGFTMPLIDMGVVWKLTRLIDPTLRANYNMDNSLRTRLVVALNLAALVDGLHAHRHCFIDLKPDNIFVYSGAGAGGANRRGYVVMLDSDGFAIAKSATGTERFPAQLATPGYMLPSAEKSFDIGLLNRNGLEQDNWALGKIIFQLLNEGLDPFSGALVAGGPGEISDRSAEGATWYAYAIKGNQRIKPDFTSIHAGMEPALLSLFERTFTMNAAGVRTREWVQALKPLLSKSRACKNNPDHWKLGPRCGQCETERATGAMRQATAPLPKQQPAPPPPAAPAGFKPPPPRFPPTPPLTRRTPPPRKPVRAQSSGGSWKWVLPLLILFSVGGGMYLSARDGQYNYPREEPASEPVDTTTPQPVQVRIAAYTPTTPLVAGDNGANARAQASVLTALVHHFDPGAPLVVNGRGHDGTHTWYRVVLPGGATGFVRADVTEEVAQVRVVAYRPREPLVAPPGGTVARGAPSTAAQAQYAYGEGQSINVTGRYDDVSGAWYRVVLPSGIEGYVPANSVETVSARQVRLARATPQQQQGHSQFQALPQHEASVEWAQRPSARSVGRHYPRRALAAGRSGDVSLDCVVRRDLQLSCTIASESPPGEGFGRAALEVAEDYRAQRARSDGSSSVGARTAIRIRFQAPQ